MKEMLYEVRCLKSNEDIILVNVFAKITRCHYTKYNAQDAECF